MLFSSLILRVAEQLVYGTHRNYAYSAYLQQRSLYRQHFSINAVYRYAVIYIQTACAVLHFPLYVVSKHHT